MSGCTRRLPGEFPCGKCLGCRIQRRTEWSVRLMHELAYWSDACYVTLTYNDDNLPVNGSLVKSDLQKFFKRLRKDVAPGRLRHFSCGEYGGQFGRPHYHSIIFGVAPDSELILNNWPFGYVKVGQVSWNSVKYVCGYIFDKIYGNNKLAEDKYGAKEREFQLQSLGIGKQWALDHPYIVDDLKITIHGRTVSVPRYYLKLYKVLGTEVPDDVYLDLARDRQDKMVLAAFRDLPDLSDCDAVLTEYQRALGRQREAELEHNLNGKRNQW